MCFSIWVHTRQAAKGNFNVILCWQFAVYGTVLTGYNGLAFTMVGVFMAIRYWWQTNVLRVIKPSNSYKLFEKYFPTGCIA